MSASLSAGGSAGVTSQGKGEDRGMTRFLRGLALLAAVVVP